MAEFADIVAPLEAELFLEFLKDGTPPLHAAIEVGWSPAKLRKMMSDPDFAALCAEAEDHQDETIEQALFRQAEKGNMAAIQMWLYNRQPDRWRDTKRIEVKTETTIQVGIVASVKEAAIALLREHGVGELQAAVIDAEVVDDEG